MGSARRACDTCHQNCFSKHWKNHGEPPKICAFFKSMIGNGFDISMVMPPTFSKKLKSLAGEKFTLEDSSSRKWNVLLTRTEGSLAFVAGWLNFVLDHDIQYGDFLVFYYLSDRRFLVEIYDKSACTKIFPSERIDTNRTTATTRNSIPRKRSYDSLDEQSTSKKHFHPSFSGPSTVVTPRSEHVHNEKEPVFENLDELYFMTRRDTSSVGEDDRDRLFDLSQFETPVKKPIKDEESDKFRNAGTETGHVDLHQCQLPERKTEVLSGGKMKLTNQEARAFKQDVCGNVMADNSLGASDSPSEQSYRNPGATLIHTTKVEEYTEAGFPVHGDTPPSSNSPNDSLPFNSIKPQQTFHKSENLDLSAPPGWKMRPPNQEAKAFKQDDYVHVMADNCRGANDSPSEQSYRNPGGTLFHTMKIEGGTSRPIKQEARELKPDNSCCPMSGCLGANFFVREQTMMNCVGEFVKAEPLDCVDPSEIGVEIACSSVPMQDRP